MPEGIGHTIAISIRYPFLGIPTVSSFNIGVKRSFTEVWVILNTVPIQVAQIQKVMWKFV